MSLRQRVASSCLASALSVALLASAQAADRGTFGPFMRSLNAKDYGYRVVADPTGGAPTPFVERFVVRPGDCAANTGWNDCANDRERSELSEKGERNKSGTTWWYGWCLYLPSDYPNVYPTKVALGQFHQTKSHPAWMFQNSSGGYHLDNHVTGGGARYHRLIDEADLRGRWHRIEIQARWSRGADGFMRVWVDGKRKVDHTGPTMDADEVYFKYGVYRSFLSCYKTDRKVDAVPPQIVYFANVRRSATREGLAVPSRD